jgi:MFS family permease
MSQPPQPANNTRALYALLASTFFELMGVFMLLPLNLLRLKGSGLDTATAGLFAATSYVAIFLVTPFVSSITHAIGRRNTLWLTAVVPVFTCLVFALSPWVATWFVAQAVAGIFGGMRWVLAEALVSEFAPPEQRGRFVGLFETLVGITFLLGPLALVWAGPTSTYAVWIAFAFVTTGALCTAFIPVLPRAGGDHNGHAHHLGLRGVWTALRAYPVIMLAGFLGGFFEAGLTSILPLYGLQLGWDAKDATLLVAASGLGSALLMLPAGMLADHLSKPVNGQHRAFWGNASHTRLQLMRLSAWITLAATLVLPFALHYTALAWPIALAWGSAGGVLYTFAMIDIGSRDQGTALVSGTAVLVLAYTVGGMCAPALGSAALQYSPAIAFPLLLASVAATGVWLLQGDKAGLT